MNPARDAVVFGGGDSLYIFTHNSKRKIWDEKDIQTYKGLYAITALCWKPDGSKLALGNVVGGVDLFDTYVRRVEYQTQFILTHVSASQVRNPTNKPSCFLEAH